MGELSLRHIPDLSDTSALGDFSESSFYSVPASATPSASPDPMSRTRSPGAMSESSNFTSVSPRGVNPNWTPGYGLAGHPLPPSSHAGYAPQRGNPADALVTANPDFALPTGRAGHVRGGSAGGSHHYPVV